MYCQAEANREASAWLEENWGAWYGILQRAWYMAEMYDLDRPRREVMYDPEMRVHPYRLATQFWWKTTHGGKMIPNRCKSADALTVMGRDADAALAWSCFVGMEKSRGNCLSATAMRLALVTSGDRIVWGARIWNEQTPDFRAMVRCLSGDLASTAMRHLVLGEGAPDEA